jgi:ParB family transcriptional regulator, chromosome partitioning protein
MATSRSRGLGKGLEALFNDVEINMGETKERTSEVEGSIVFIDIHKIKPNSNQPRKHFDDNKIEELARSIEAHGIIQPIMVRATEIGYEIVAGERRWRAARRAGLKEVPCIIRELTEEENMLVSLIENMQREDLNAIEEALGIERMIATFGLTQEEVSNSVGKSRPYISNALRLLKLPATVQEMVINGMLSGGHARAVAGIKDAKKQVAAAQKCVELGWSVREIENFARGEDSSISKRKPMPRPKNRDVSVLEEDLKEILGTKVNIIFGSKKGKIEIEYYSREELERLLQLLQKLR